MPFVVTHRLGDMERDVAGAGLAALLDELAADRDDQEHVDVAVADESGWTLTISADVEGKYRLAWEDVEESVAPPLHMASVERGEALRVMSLVAAGALDDVAALNWREGY